MSLPSSMGDFVPCDRLLQKAYCTDIKKILVVSGPCGWSTHKRKTRLRWKMSFYLVSAVHSPLLTSSGVCCGVSSAVLF